MNATNENVPAVDLPVAPGSGEDVSTTNQQDEGASPMISHNQNAYEYNAEDLASDPVIGLMKRTSAGTATKDDMETVVEIGDGTQKLWGEITKDDLVLMDKIRHDATQKYVVEQRADMDAFEKISKEMKAGGFRNYGEMMTAKYGPKRDAALVEKVATKSAIRAGNALRGDHAEITPDDMYTPLEIDMDGKTGVRLLRDLRAQDLRDWVDSERKRTGLDADPEYWGALNAANEMDREGLQIFDDHIYAVFGPMIVD